MTDLDDLPELVRHLQLEAVFKHTRTVHKLLRPRQGSQKQETWIREKKIGHGGFGEVWLERKLDGRRSASDAAELRAVKCIHSSLKRRDYVRELEALATFSSNKSKYNEFFVQFHGWFESTDWLHAVMEYCEHGDLRHYLGKHSRLPEGEVQDIARQLLVGVSLMHKAGFAHRDIKPANIFIKSAPPANWWVKLGDLGLSKRTEEITSSSTVRATPGFIPPELLGFTREDPKRADRFCSDIWCLAETVFHALTDQGVFDTYLKLVDYAARRIPFPEEALNEVNTSELGIDFIQSMMNPMPLERLTAELALKHPWLTTEEDNKSTRDDVDSVQDTTVLTIFTPQCEDITQPAANWTSDIETARLKVPSDLPVKFDQIERPVEDRDRTCLPQESSTTTTHVVDSRKHQAYVEDADEDSSSVACDSTFLQKLPTDVATASLVQHSSEGSTENLPDEQELRETEAEPHDEDNSSVEAVAPSSMTCTLDFPRSRSSKPKVSKPIHHRTSKFKKDTQDQDSEHMKRPGETSAQKLRPRTTLPKGRKKPARTRTENEDQVDHSPSPREHIISSVSSRAVLQTDRPASKSKTNPEHDIVPKEARPISPALDDNGIGRGKRITNIRSKIVSKHILVNELDYSYKDFGSYIQIHKRLTKHEIDDIIRMSKEHEKERKAFRGDSKLTVNAVCRLPSSKWIWTEKPPSDVVAHCGRRCCSPDVLIFQRKNPFCQRCFNCEGPVEIVAEYAACPCGAIFCSQCGERWKTCDCPRPTHKMVVDWLDATKSYFSGPAETVKPRSQNLANADKVAPSEKGKRPAYQSALEFAALFVQGRGRAEARRKKDKE